MEDDLTLSGWKPISYEEMMELVSSKKEVVLTSRGTQLYYKKCPKEVEEFVRQ